MITELNREDNLLMSLSGITDKSETFLDVVHDSLIFRPYDYNVRLSYEIFIDLNLRTIDR